MFLFVPYSISGHIHPVLPVVAELAARGHTVRVITGQRYAVAVEAAGGQVACLPAVPDVVVPERAAGRLTPHFLAGRIRRLRINRRAAIMLEQELRRMGERDVVVIDPMLGWADRVVGRHQRPIAVLSTTFHMGADALVEMSGRDRWPIPRWVQRLRPLARRYETRGRLVLANSVSGLQPLGHALPRDVHLVGPLLRPHDEKETAFEHGGGRVLLVSPGTVFARGRKFFDRFVRAFAGSSWRVYLATGHLDPADLGVLPPNVVARRFLPQLRLLERCDVFVTHAGMNSVMEGLAAGVPMLLFPRSAEQRHLARCVVAGGAGRWPQPDDLSPAALFTLVETLADDRAVRAALRGWQKRLAAGGGAARAADLLEAWAAGQPASPTLKIADAPASSPAV